MLSDDSHDSIQIRHFGIIFCIKGAGFWRIIVVYLALQTFVYVGIAQQTVEQCAENDGSCIEASDNGENAVRG